MRGKESDWVALNFTEIQTEIYSSESNALQQQRGPLYSIRPLEVRDNWLDQAAA